MSNASAVRMVVHLEEYRANAIAEAAIHGAMRKLSRAMERIDRFADWRTFRDVARTHYALSEIAIDLRIEREQWEV